jgi:hypothetical protein
MKKVEVLPDKRKCGGVNLGLRGLVVLPGVEVPPVDNHYYFDCWILIKKPRRPWKALEHRGKRLEIINNYQQGNFHTGQNLFVGNC